MDRIIAVHVGPSGEAASISEPGRLQLYEKQQNAWKVIVEHPFALKPDQGLREMRRQMGALLTTLKDCKVIVASSITGVPYYELERAGFSLWEYSGKPANFLDQVLAGEAANDQPSGAGPVSIPAAEDLGNGCFSISIQEIQQANSGVTSKQVLQPLLRRSGWYRLEVRCAHMPPWLEAEAMLGNFIYATKKTASGITVTLQKKVCGER